MAGHYSADYIKIDYLIERYNFVFKFLGHCSCYEHSFKVADAL